LTVQVVSRYPPKESSHRQNLVWELDLPTGASESALDRHPPDNEIVLKFAVIALEDYVNARIDILVANPGKSRPVNECNGDISTVTKRAAIPHNSE
jgi:hypothetical protein